MSVLNIRRQEPLGLFVVHSEHLPLLLNQLQVTRNLVSQLLHGIQLLFELLGDLPLVLENQLRLDQREPPEVLVLGVLFPGLGRGSLGVARSVRQQPVFILLLHKGLLLGPLPNLEVPVGGQWLGKEARRDFVVLEDFVKLADFVQFFVDYPAEVLLVHLLEDRDFVVHETLASPEVLLARLLLQMGQLEGLAHYSFLWFNDF